MNPTRLAVACIIGLSIGHVQAQTPRYDTIIRRGTVIDGSGNPRFDADIASGAILRFGSEADLVKNLQHPTTSMACDCGASTATRVHPRFYGSYPRVLGRYVREQQIMSWEEAIRKSSALPAATIGMIDRGLIAVGMAVDLVVLSPASVIDRATCEAPALPSGGRALLRDTAMPSRPMATGARSVAAELKSSDGGLVIDVAQRAGARSATGDSSSGPSSGLAMVTLTIEDERLSRGAVSLRTLTAR